MLLLHQGREYTRKRNGAGGGNRTRDSGMARQRVATTLRPLNSLTWAAIHGAATVGASLRCVGFCGACSRTGVRSAGSSNPPYIACVSQPR